MRNLMVTKAIQAEQATARDTLRARLTVGATLRTVVRHASRSGMFRTISVFAVDADGELSNLDSLIARAGIGKFSRSHGGIEMGGCGMDMGFSLVYNIGRALYPDGVKCTGRNYSTATKRVPVCHSNDHVNDRGAPDYRRTRKHSDGGYAFRQAWM